MQFITLEQIKQVLPTLDLIPEIENGFQAYSKGLVTVPPIGEMILEKGEVHIKYGYVHGDEYYVIKIASGFYENQKLGLSSSNGLMLLFSQQTGELRCVLLDEGHLTNIRTAIAGAIVAKQLAPNSVNKIGIVGAGIQGRLQLHYLKDIITCREVIAWGINREELDQYKRDMEMEGFEVETTEDTRLIQEQCNLIVTATPSKNPLLRAEYLQEGTHITAMGSDTTEKQELDPVILRKADIVVADSIDQCMQRGEIYKAMAAGVMEKEKIVELGNIISGASLGRTAGEQITVADLTGVAVQDMNIATAVYEAFNNAQVKESI